MPPVPAAIGLGYLSIHLGCPFDSGPWPVSRPRTQSAREPAREWSGHPSPRMTILWRHPTIGRNGPRLGAPGDVPKRTGDTAPPRPVAPVSTVTPASSVAPVSIVTMAPIAPMASILLPQHSRDDGRRLCRARDARTKANGAEPQCADHRSSGCNLLQIHCQTPFPTPL